MPIGIETEALIPFPQAAKTFPGRPITIQTLHRYRTNGVRGVKLDTCLIGGFRYTSTEAISRFITAQNAPEQAPLTISPSQRARQSEAARRELAKMGI